MFVVKIMFQLLGSISLLLFGMKMMSDGIQKSTDTKLRKILSVMTNNRIVAVFTGLFVTSVIQSSGATTVMVVSFVNAGLLTLKQSVGIIFGANIGTTVTAWIVSIMGSGSFDLGVLAISILGVGYLLTVIKKINKKSLGEALIGFGLLFLGLDMLSSVIPYDTGNISKFEFMKLICKPGALSIFLGIITGIGITVLLHSSSAATAIVLALSAKGIITWEFSAAVILGSNIGSTVDAVLASVGTKVHAKRAALVHVLFNVAGTILAIIFFKPLLSLVDFIIPGEPSGVSMQMHIAMLHTVFNVTNTLIFLPFVNQIAALTEKIIKPENEEKPEVYKLEFIEVGTKENTTAYIMRAEKEIADMTDISMNMFTNILDCLSTRNMNSIENYFESLAKQEDYADQMKDQLSNYLIRCTQLPMAETSRNNVTQMLHIVDELESLTDECFSIGVQLQKSVSKNMKFAQEDLDRLVPYVELVYKFLDFIKQNINRHLSKEQLDFAENLENQIDLFRKNLKKTARKRLENGADVKSELLYIDLVRSIEKIGDRAFSISESLALTV